MIGIRPEDITKRFRELSASHKIRSPIAGDGQDGRVSKQWMIRGGTTQIKCELCPQPNNTYCNLSCNLVRRVFDETNPVKVKTFA